MVTYYCFLNREGLLSPDVKVFKVKVGTSPREVAKCSLIEEYANDCGFFFGLWDESVDVMLSSRVDPTFRCSFSIGLGYKVVHVSVSKLMKAIIGGYVDSLEDAPYVALNYFKLASKLSPKFFFANSISKMRKAVPTFPRKNLSEKERSDRLQAYIGFALLFLLYWLGCLLRQWENSMF